MAFIQDQNVPEANILHFFDVHFEKLGRNDANTLVLSANIPVLLGLLLDLNSQLFSYLDGSQQFDNLDLFVVVPPFFDLDGPVVYEGRRNNNEHLGDEVSGHESLKICADLDGLAETHVVCEDAPIILQEVSV